MDIYQAINERRSIRKFQTKKIEDQTLLKLAEAAIKAPNGGNAQPWDFIFITQPELIAEIGKILEEVHDEYFGTARKDNLEGEQLKKVVSSYKRMSNAPVFVLVCMNIRNQQLNQPYVQWTTEWAHHSIAAAMENMILAAVAEGLGTCWLGSPSWKANQLKQRLGIPEHVQIVAMSPIGYPDQAPKARPRLAVEEVTHFNQW